MRKSVIAVLLCTFFCFFAGRAFAHVCLVPEGLCATKGCAALASEDILTYPVSHTDGDTNKISIQHQQSSTAQPSPLVLDVCFEPNLSGANDKHAATYDLIIAPTTGMMGPTDLSSCLWDCSDLTSCDGWHRIQEDPGAFTPDQLGQQCDNTSIEATYSVNVSSMSQMPSPWDTTYPNGNVVLARINFTGVNKDTATISVGAGAPLYGVDDPANIAKPLIDNATEVDEFDVDNDITGTVYQTEIQVIPTQCTPNPVTSVSSLTCVPATTGSPLCSDSPTPAQALTTVSLSWTEPNPPCTLGAGLCGTVSYDIYVGGTKAACGDVCLVSDDFSGTASSSTVLGIGDVVDFYVYTNTSICGSESTGIKLGDTTNCKCRTAQVTNATIGGVAVTSAEPQAGGDIKYTLTVQDSESTFSDLTIYAYIGCGGTGCTDTNSSTYADPAQVTVCSPATTPCSSSVTFTLDGETYANFEDEETSETLAVAFIVNNTGSGFPTDFTGAGDTVPCCAAGNLYIEGGDGGKWSFSDILIFKKDNEPYPSQLPFVATGNNTLCIKFELIKEANVTMRIYHPDGTLIRVLDNDTSASTSVDSCDDVAENKCHWKAGCKWDGTSYLGEGNLVANGLYLLHMYAVGTADPYVGHIIERQNGIVLMK